MKERGILFSAPMVRAIRDDRKTQTRRVIMPQPPEDVTFAGLYSSSDGKLNWLYDWCTGDPKDIDTWVSANTKTFRCPYGKPGDRLWVRETWQQFFEDEMPAGRPKGPRGTMGIPAQPERLSYVYYRADGDDIRDPEPPNGKARWITPIHMPRWASRLTLELVSINVERVQQITHRGIAAEGVGWYEPEQSTPFHYGQHRAQFEALWDSINKERGYGWDMNPWVWVVEFRKL